jgi:HEPN domain-containing protein
MKKPKWPQEPKRVLLEAANVRLQDAKVLLKSKRYSGAVYLGGYVIECMLKVAICDYLGVSHLPGQYAVHNLELLLSASGLQKELKASLILTEQFDVILKWTVSIRYRGAVIQTEEARKFMKAVLEVREWLLKKRK